MLLVTGWAQINFEVWQLDCTTSDWLFLGMIMAVARPLGKP